MSYLHLFYSTTSRLIWNFSYQTIYRILIYFVTGLIYLSYSLPYWIKVAFKLYHV